MSVSDEVSVVAATVIRVAPDGFSAPYVLAAVRSGEGLALGRVETPVPRAPAVGTPLFWLRDDRGTAVYRVAED